MTVWKWIECKSNGQRNCDHHKLHVGTRARQDGTVLHSIECDECDIIWEGESAP